MLYPSGGNDGESLLFTAVEAVRPLLVYLSNREGRYGCEAEAGMIALDPRTGGVGWRIRCFMCEGHRNNSLSFTPSPRQRRS